MKETMEYQNIRENKKYKDTLFRMVFKNKKDLLDLYNAVNHTNYEDETVLEVNTLENVLYISMKNDASFIIGNTMNLYEHQSTKNENMPLRGLLYFAKMYENYIMEHDVDLFSSKIQKIPTPKYIVFYNGTEQEADKRILKLSDAFIKEGGCLECEVLLLNINYGRNRELMEKCRRLEEYSLFVATVRNYKQKDISLRKAITLAIDECIEKGILLDILTKQRNEVLEVVLSTFNQELYEKNLKQDAYEEGMEAGIEAGKLEEKKAFIHRNLKKGKTIEEIAELLDEDKTKIQQLANG